MNKNLLYREALKYMLMVAEYQELGDVNDGYVYEKLLEKGYDEDLITKSITNMGLIGENVSQAYLDCFTFFGVEEEYRTYTEDMNKIEVLTQEILEECESVMKAIESGAFYSDFPNFIDISKMI